MKHDHDKTTGFSCRNRRGPAGYFAGVVIMTSLLAGGVSAEAQQLSQRIDPAIGKLEQLKATLAERGKTAITQDELEALSIVASRQSRTQLTQPQISKLEALRRSASTLAQNACSAEKMAELTAAPTASNYRVVLNCTPNFTTPATIRKQVVFEGEEASFTGLDCKGGTISKPAIPGSDDDNPEAVIIRSKKLSAGNWSVPDMVYIRNCNITGGGVRIYGMGRNASADDVKASSKNVTHTLDARQAAPYAVQLDDVTITSPSAINVYAGNGVVDLDLINSTVTNNGKNPVVYLEAETIGAFINNNEFSIANPGREYIAVDGSQSNQITNNTFQNPVRGGIFLYRNCGEDGSIRHATPTSNQITGNRFVYTSTPLRHGIWVGSRGGKDTIDNPVCSEDSYNGLYDAILPNSSAPAKKNGDFAYFNTVKNNVFDGWPSTSAYKMATEDLPSGSLYNGTNGYDLNVRYNTFSNNTAE